MKVQTSELIGNALNYAVAVAAKLKVYDGWQSRWTQYEDGQSTDWYFDLGSSRIITKVFITNASRAGAWFDGEVYSPSTDWAQGGPILARMFADGLQMSQDSPGTVGGEDCWARHGSVVQKGMTPLVAAMRYFVASTLGAEVDLPASLFSG